MGVSQQNSFGHLTHIKLLPHKVIVQKYFVFPFFIFMSLKMLIKLHLTGSKVC